MSTQYLIGCKAHRRQIALTSVPPRPWLDSTPERINAFVWEHCGCCGVHGSDEQGALCGLKDDPADPCAMSLIVICEGSDYEEVDGGK